MKQSALGMMLMVSILALPGHAQAADTANAEQQVSKLLRDWVTAENEHDAAALDRILDDQFISTYAAGKPTRKARFIESLTKGQADPRQS